MILLLIICPKEGDIYLIITPVFKHLGNISQIIFVGPTVLQPIKHNINISRQKFAIFNLEKALERREHLNSPRREE